MVVAVLSAQYLGLGLRDVVLLLQDFLDKIFDGDFGLEFPAQIVRPASRKSSKTRLLFRRISNNIELARSATDESRSSVIRADVVRSNQLVNAKALVCVSERSKGPYRRRTALLGKARCLEDMTISAQPPRSKNVEGLFRMEDADAD